MRVENAKRARKNEKISSGRLGERDELMMNRLKSNKGGGVEEEREGGLKNSLVC